MSDTSKKVVFSEALLAQIGIQPWQAKPGVDFFATSEEKASESVEVSQPNEKPSPSPQNFSDEPSASEHLNPKPEELQQDENSEAIAHTDNAQPISLKSDLPFILIGADLDSIWQNESTLEWQLLQNIARVFDWDLENLHYYDTRHLVSEEAIFATLEEVMEMQVDWVVSMDSESVLAEHLEEGLQMIRVPSLEELLADAFAKKDCFMTLSNARFS